MGDRLYKWVPYRELVINLVNGWHIGKSVNADTGHHAYAILMWKPA